MRSALRTLDIDEVKQIQLQLLKWFKNICNENHIGYCLSGGTLIGAIRHNGFIPWDDDIDVMMPREDYDKFTSLMQKENYYPYEFRCLANRKTSYPYGKLVDLRTEYRVKDSNVRGEDAIWIDVFPMDNLPNNEMECTRFFKKARAIKKIFELSVLEPKTETRISRRIIKRILHSLASLYGQDRAAMLMDRHCRKYNNTNGEYFGVVCWGYGLKEKMMREKWTPYIPVLFEGETYNAPYCYDAYLSSLYGNYMELPPVSKRVGRHDIEAYIKD